MNEMAEWSSASQCLQPCCSQSELHFRIILLSRRTLVKLGFSVGSFLFAWSSSHQRSVLLTDTSVSHRPVFALSYFGSALLVEAADRCCVLTSLPLNSCLFLCNYSHWWAPPPCGVTLCLLAAISNQALFVSPWNCSFMLECLCVVVVGSRILDFSSFLATLQPCSILNCQTCASYSEHTFYGGVPLRFKHTFTLCTLGAAEESRRCWLPELH